MASPNVVAAAEELAKAVMDHSNRVSIENAMAPLKESMDDKLNTLNQSVTHLKESLINLTDEVGSLKVELTATKDQLLAQVKNQNLLWSIDNCSIGAFLKDKDGKWAIYYK